ncbi:MAG: PorV/PorQ family protein [Calditrichia bacterium]|nr:PorV/PorQ family protein [Calditrichia bacterium]
MRKLLFFVVLMAIGSFEIMAQANSTLLFLRINPGARQAAMGDAGVALADDAYAMFYNPAGLAFQYDPEDETSSRGQASTTYAKWLPGFNFNDIYYLYGAGRYYFDGWGMFGASLQYFNYGKIARTDADGNSLGDFSSNETALSLAYSLLLTEKLSVGFTGKYIYSNLSPVGTASEGSVGGEDGRASTVGVDIGLLYKTRLLNYGIAISNMGPNVTYVDKAQADPMPTVLRAGIAYKPVNNEFHRVTLTYELNRELTRRRGALADNFPKSLFTTWQNEDNFGLFTHGLGAEYWYTDLVAMRGGYFYETAQNGDRRFFSLGMGLKYLYLGIEFSYIYAVKEFDPLADTMRFSLLFDF